MNHCFFSAKRPHYEEKCMQGNVGLLEANVQTIELIQKRANWLMSKVRK